jgi:hypothetical protein
MITPYNEPASTMLTHTGMTHHSEPSALCLPATRYGALNKNEIVLSHHIIL